MSRAVRNWLWGISLAIVCVRGFGFTEMYQGTHWMEKRGEGYVS
jgi:hypothetical protein